MTTSPEALREAVERVADFATEPNTALFDRQVPHLKADLRTLLSALQEAREALGPTIWTAIEVVVTAEDEARDQSATGRGLVDCRDNSGDLYQSSSLHSALTILRRAAEVYRALSPGGADE